MFSSMCTRRVFVTLGVMSTAGFVLGIIYNVRAAHQVSADRQRLEANNCPVTDDAYCPTTEGALEICKTLCASVFRSETVSNITSAVLAVSSVGGLISCAAAYFRGGDQRQNSEEQQEPLLPFPPRT